MVDARPCDTPVVETGKAPYRNIVHDVAKEIPPYDKRILLWLAAKDPVNEQSEEERWHFGCLSNTDRNGHTWNVEWKYESRAIRFWMDEPQDPRPSQSMPETKS